MICKTHCLRATNTIVDFQLFSILSISLVLTFLNYSHISKYPHQFTLLHLPSHCYQCYSLRNICPRNSNFRFLTVSRSTLAAPILLKILKRLTCNVYGILFILRQIHTSVLFTLYNISVEIYIYLFPPITNEHIFTFDNKCCRQKFDLPMGSYLICGLVYLFLEFLESGSFKII